MDVRCSDGRPALERLSGMGFKPAGQWILDGDSIRPEVDAGLGLAANVLYAFVLSKDVVVYIGKSVLTLRQRMQSYRTPGVSQATNIRNRQNVMRELRAGHTVEIFVLPDNGLLAYGGFHVNLAAGLEDAL